MTKLYKVHHNRMKIILFFIFSFVSIASFKTIYIQLFKSENKIIGRQIDKKGDRGTIYDRYNNKLAYDIDFYDIYVDDLNYSDTLAVKYFLGEYFSEYNYSFKPLIKGKQTLLEGVPYHVVENLNDVFNKFPEIKKSIKYKGRYYPQKGLASQLIGRFSHKNDTIGGWGIERTMNNNLKAKIGPLDYLVTSRGFNREDFSDNDFLKLSGEDVVLTIDLKYQTILEEELISQLRKTNSKSANGIIVDPFSGEILAMASVPTSNLNEKLPSTEFIRDYVCQVSYEPGSTLKPFSILAGLSNNIIDLAKKYYCENGKYKVPNLKRKPVVDHDPYDTLSVKQILAHSSNIGLVKISSEIGREKIYNTFKEFGFGQKTGIDSYYDDSGILKDLEDWDPHSLISIPIGQELRVTNLQIAMAYSAIANGGYLMEPKIVIENRNIDNYKLVREIKGSNDNDIELLIESLKMVVSDGTAAPILGQSSVCSYGKTGTAQVYDSNIQKYSDSTYISSYAGIFPCDKPELVCVVSFIEPDEDKKWASQSAVPAFNEILNRISNEDRNLAIHIEDEIR